MEKQYRYIDYIKRNWKDLLLLLMVMFPIVTMFIFRRWMIKFIEKIWENNKDFNRDIHTGKYRKDDHGEYEEIIMVKDFSWSYLSLTMMYLTIPIMMTMIILLFTFFPPTA